MQNAEAKEKLNKYLESLWYLVINLNRYVVAIRDIDDAMKVDKVQNLGQSGNIFYHLRYLAVFNIVVNIGSIFDPNKDAKRSIHWYLDQSFTHANHLTKNKCLLKHEIEICKSTIQDFDSDLRTIRQWRDKWFAHHDKKYFDDPHSLQSNFPLSISSIETIVNFLKELIRSHRTICEMASLNWLEGNLYIDSVLAQLAEWPRLRANQK
ncbi:MAG: hypothetical protein K1X36_06625 [Pyrinomonadaceae bacterium]|nr:hypothetical protein [Pyrinomonadaceae bacterium]